MIDPKYQKSEIREILTPIYEKYIESNKKIDKLRKSFLLCTGLCAISLIGTFGYDLYQRRYNEPEIIKEYQKNENTLNQINSLKQNLVDFNFENNPKTSDLEVLISEKNKFYSEISKLEKQVESKQKKIKDMSEYKEIKDKHSKTEKIGFGFLIMTMCFYTIAEIFKDPLKEYTYHKYTEMERKALDEHYRKNQENNA